MRTDVVTKPIIKIGTLESCHVRLADERVSQVRAIIEVYDAKNIRLIDLGGSSGTFHNGQRILPGGVPGGHLRNGDEISLGDTRRVVEITSGQ